MPKYIIFGGNGMLAHAIKNNSFFADNIAPDIAECDITDNNFLLDFIKRNTSDYIINCAAYTNVTQAETELECAMGINAIGAMNLAVVAQRFGIRLVHFSTDFVFKGDKDIEYTEGMATNPVNSYGLSKLKGERYISDLAPHSLIIRTSWLYGENGQNFASNIAGLMQTRGQLKIVADQFGKTTYTQDLAEATKHLISKNAQGIFHFANSGVSSRYEFTQAIYEALHKRKGFQCEILPIKAVEYNDPTPRPTWSVLNCDKYQRFTGEKVRDWHEALGEYLSQL